MTALFLRRLLLGVRFTLGCASQRTATATAAPAAVGVVASGAAGTVVLEIAPLSTVDRLLVAVAVGTSCGLRHLRPAAMVDGGERRHLTLRCMVPSMLLLCLTRLWRATSRCMACMRAWLRVAQMWGPSVLLRRLWW